MTTPQTDTSGLRTEPKHSLIAASRVRGAPVFNTTGERVGEIEDLAIDKRSGEVAYAIMAFGGFLGIGERFHPVPWGILHFDPTIPAYVIPCDKEALKAAPTFDAHEVSGWDTAPAQNDVMRYYHRYGAPPF